MPYDVDPGSVLEVTIEGNLCGQAVMTVFHYELSGGAAIDGPTAITNFDAQFNVLGTGMCKLYNDAACDNFQQVRIAYQWIYPVRFRKIYKPPTFVGGVLAGPANTANIAAAITKLSDVATKRGQSTLHYPALPYDGYANGLLDPANRALLVIIANKVKTNIVAAARGYTPLIYGRATPAYTKCGRDYPAKAVSRLPIDDVYVQDTVRVMRRRTVGLGI